MLQRGALCIFHTTLIVNNFITQTKEFTSYEFGRAPKGFEIISKKLTITHSASTNMGKNYKRSWMKFSCVSEFTSQNRKSHKYEIQKFTWWWMKILQEKLIFTGVVVSFIIILLCLEGVEINLEFFAGDATRRISLRETLSMSILCSLVFS